jgi:acid stress-induced BolA-like protein IbaG/YrbA
MSDHPTDFQGDILEAIRDAVRAKMDGANVEVSGGNGHYTIEVVHPVFEGKSRLESQRLVLQSIAHLMKGDRPPVHAVDSLKTRAS